MSNSETYSIPYSDFYDLLYQEKNYLEETKYLLSKIRHYNPDVKIALELGSGTGNYTQLLCENGLIVTGVEKSYSMLNKSISKNIKGFFPIHSDLLEYDNPNHYDIILALFHVLNYITEEIDIKNCFQRVSKNLKKSGLFYFDIWHKPAVQYLKLPTRVKRAENKDFKITRISESKFISEGEKVQIDFDIFIDKKPSENLSNYHETHIMRPFHPSEIEIWANAAGLTILEMEEFYTGLVPDQNTWSVGYILQKV